MSTDYSSQPPDEPFSPTPRPPKPPSNNNLLIIILGSVLALFMFCCIVGLTAISFLGQVTNKTFSNVQSAIQSTGS